MPGSKFGNENSFTQKFYRSEENSLPGAEYFLGFVKCFSEFAKGIDKTFDRNFFNLVIINVVVVFSIVHEGDPVGNPVLVLKSRSKTTLHHNN